MRTDKLAGPYADLLMMTFPLLKLVKGQKSAALRRAWINAANNVGADVLNIEEGRLPQGPRAAALALLRAALEMAEAMGVSRPDLVDYFNDRADTGEIGTADGIDDAIARAHALLCLVAARRITATNNETVEGRAAV